MPEKEIAIVDTSVLIAFEKLDMLVSLCSLYGEVLLSEAVYREYAGELYECFTLIKAPQELTRFLVENIELGIGEAEAISLAYNTKTRLLLDDLQARKYARQLGCHLSGTIGLLYKMEQNSIIDSAYQEALTLKKLGFRLSDNLIKRLSWQ